MRKDPRLDPNSRRITCGHANREFGSQSKNSVPVAQLLHERQFGKSLSGIKPEDYSVETDGMLLITLSRPHGVARLSREIANPTARAFSLTERARLLIKVQSYKRRMATGMDRSWIGRYTKVGRYFSFVRYSSSSILPFFESP
ncbi:hypothetical protein KPH14_005919 [Odynerus spinipes]|uniref:Uncharacterized protein n=1 Tax=Odynerus spinipes TaxID=1348599 RepID=A0AAD9RJK6_9HYME|nr:hypothetical protein KPH14_005919 [Odynerus spinipes]